MSLFAARATGAPVLAALARTSEHLIVLEDDALMRDAVVHALEEAGYRVTGVASRQAFEAVAQADPPALLVIDRGLPDGDGAEVARHWSERQTVGIVMLTAYGALDERLRGWEHGADAYLVKPVDWRELVLTVKAVLKRLRPPADMASAPAGFEFMPRQFRMTAPDGQSIPLNAQESVLIDHLLREPGEVVDKVLLMEALGAHGDAWGEARLAQTVSRLRRKIEALAPGWNPLRTVYRVGYAFVV
jgi:DNA-binding response OmpR family regulator